MARHLVMGATGHIGSVVAQTLLAQGEEVVVLLHTPGHQAEWQQRGATVAVADVHDLPRLRDAFRQARRLFLLNPPADPATNIDVEERRSVAAILAALPGSGIERIVAASTYGAQPGAHLGDLGVLYELEQALAAQPIPASIIRGAYYFSNWDQALEPARQRGELPTLYPADFQLPMVAPRDIGGLAAQLLAAPAASPGPHCLEGPRAYTPADVAAAFAEALRRPVAVATIPRPQWQPALRGMGFSGPAAQSFANMAALTLTQVEKPAHPLRGRTTLEAYVRELVK